MSYRDDRHRARRQTTTTDGYQWSDWIQDDRRQDREYRWRINSRGKTVYENRTLKVSPEIPRNDEDLSPSQYGSLVHFSAVNSPQYYENNAYQYRDNPPASGQVNEVTYAFADTSIDGSSAAGEYLHRGQSPTVETSPNLDSIGKPKAQDCSTSSIKRVSHLRKRLTVIDSSTSNPIPIQQRSWRSDPTANEFIPAGNGASWAGSPQNFISEANTEYVLDTEIHDNTSQGRYGASNDQDQQSLSNSLVTVVPLGWKAPEQTSPVRSFQYSQPQWSNDAAQSNTPAGGFHGQSNREGSSSYEATTSGPSMSWSQGPSSYSASVPDESFEKPRVTLSPSIPNSNMSSYPAIQIPKTIHKNIPTVQRKRSREKLDPKFRVQHSQYFKPGYVFKILWSEPKGEPRQSTASTDRETVVTKEPFEAKEGRYKGQKVYESIRRFIIAAADDGHCQCLPILTYGNQGTKKPGIKAKDHAIIYTEAPILLPGERELDFQPIRMTPLTPRDKLDNASRINYAKIYTVEHNVKVLFIGWIEEPHWRTFMTDFDTAWKRKRFGV